MGASTAMMAVSSVSSEDVDGATEPRKEGGGDNEGTVRLAVAARASAPRAARGRLVRAGDLLPLRFRFGLGLLIPRAALRSASATIAATMTSRLCIRWHLVISGGISSTESSGGEQIMSTASRGSFPPFIPAQRLKLHLVWPMRQPSHTKGRPGLGRFEKVHAPALR